MKISRREKPNNEDTIGTESIGIPVNSNNEIIGKTTFFRELLNMFQCG